MPFSIQNISNVELRITLFATTQPLDNITTLAKYQTFLQMPDNQQEFDYPFGRTLMISDIYPNNPTTTQCPQYLGFYLCCALNPDKTPFICLPVKELLSPKSKPMSVPHEILPGFLVTKKHNEGANSLISKIFTVSFDVEFTAKLESSLSELTQESSDQFTTSPRTKKSSSSPVVRRSALSKVGSRIFIPDSKPAEPDPACRSSTVSTSKVIISPRVEECSRKMSPKARTTGIDYPIEKS